MREKSDSTTPHISRSKVDKRTEVSTPAELAGVGSAGATDRSKKLRPAHLGDSGRSADVDNQKHSSPGRACILLLYRDQSIWERIEQAIGQERWQFYSFSSLPALRDALRDGVKVILIDAWFLSQIGQQPLCVHTSNQQQPALFFVSDRYDIGIRIQALQAGADKLFSEPVDLAALIKAIEDVMRPKSVPRFRVLVIADDELKARPTVELLQEGAMETLFQEEPLTIIDTIWRFRPDLILLLEPRSAHVDNIVLTKLIRDREESFAIPIVFLSEGEDPDKELQALRAGADDFLSSPIQPQTLLTAVVNRIERVKAVSTAGVQLIEEHPAELSGRQGMLVQLGRICSECKDNKWVYGLIVIVLGSPRDLETLGQSADRSRLVDVLSEGFGPILQAKDHMARIEDNRLAVLIRRVGKNEVRHQVDLAIEIINYHLAINATTVKRFGVGLAMIKDGGLSAEQVMRHGEQAADNAYRQWRKGYTHYIETPTPPGSAVKEASAWQREEFIYALQGGSVTIRERKFVCPGMGLGLSLAEIIELVPELDSQGAPVDTYQQAALCGATDEFDRFICECGLQRLYDYTLQGKQVRLIVRQSAAVMENPEYIEFVKGILRRFHIVGNGLLIEFPLPSIASHLHRTFMFFNELAALGIGVSLSHFPCNDAGLKALSHLKVGIVRPRVSHLHGKAGKTDIAKIVEEVHSLQTEIVLPTIECFEKVSPQWHECADFIQAESPRNELRNEQYGLPNLQL